MKYKLILVVIFSLAASLLSQEKPKIIDDLARHYGIESFRDVNSIHYVFNVERGDRKISREWTWFPSEKKVIKGSGKDKVEYIRNTFDRKDENLLKIDNQFINDNYWLLFPFRLYWDSGVTITDEGESHAPISGEKCHKLVAAYNNSDGYTPGDIYEVFLDDQLNILEWNFLPGGDLSKTFSVKWSKPENFEGILISTDHSDKSGKFRLFFTEIIVNK
ncbi:MAG: hypothetical protein D6830_07205 [Ignavibacteria bacterium]|nr:MAG: hypothetical protein D6830_07205 [Ignavibacteria bacterium]